MAQTPTIPKGMRDFSPLEMSRRNYIFDTIRGIFQRYGYQPIETPAMENLSSLTGKYGEEGDKLLFKVLNSGNFLEKANDEMLKSRKLQELAPIICEKGLRYDLTVPFARYVVQHRNEITFPFKRYQIQPVWRADRPQKGRYREFYQCDVDVIGSDSLLSEVELILITNDIFSTLGIGAEVKINNRKILSGIAEIIGQADKLIDITVAIDKIDKIGLANVNLELSEKGLPQEAINRLQPILQLKGSNIEQLLQLEKVLISSEIGLKGIAEIRTILAYLEGVKINTPLTIDLTLARGLNYYTGAILEVKATSVNMGSISGGGRYDDLTGIFGLPDVSGVGISFGADRIYDVMNELNLFPKSAEAGTQVLFVNFGEKEAIYCLGLVRKLRASGISAELYPDIAKMKKQMAYADSRKIAFVVLTGEEEMLTGKLTFKDMVSGEQSKLTEEEIIARLLSE
ncbi:MAG: histidine--tRNA ligase [Bacteroidales bacterium]